MKNKKDVSSESGDVLSIFLNLCCAGVAFVRCVFCERFARKVIGKSGDALCAERTDAEIQRYAQSVDPDCLRYEKRCEHEPVSRVSAAAQKEHAGDDERIDKDGEDPPHTARGWPPDRRGGAS